MIEQEVRTLTRTVANPCYVAGIKRGLLSVRRFNSGLPIIVYRKVPVPKNFFMVADVCIDIPILSLRAINRPLVTQRLVDASVPQMRVNYTSGKNERFVVCSCKGVLWMNLIHATTGVPVGSICVGCGRRNAFMQVFAHEAGRA